MKFVRRSLGIVLLMAGGILKCPCQVITGNTGLSAEQYSSRNLREGFLFRKEVEEVVLNVSVLDEKNRPVEDLTRNSFSITEDGLPQEITSFRREDIPVSMGLVIDSSASMIEIRSAVNQAALNLVNSSNERDQVFIINFNKEWYLDQDFTSDTGKLQRALEGVEFRGSTALYDAIRASAEHSKTHPALDKRVLIVVTDGDDNMSATTLQETVNALAVKDGPIVYAIGILRDEKKEHLKRALRLITEATGGIAYLPQNIGRVNEISLEVARDIRSQYTICYKPASSGIDSGFRTIKVLVNSPRRRRLTVRTRSGYLPGQNRILR